MKTCAFLTLDEPGGFFIDDALAHAPLAKLGWQVSDMPWRQTEVPWAEFDALVIRSPWSHQGEMSVQRRGVVERFENRYVSECLPGCFTGLSESAACAF